MPIHFHFLPAGSGDCILIRTDDFVVLIDSGDTNQYQEIKDEIQNVLKERKINLIILTHIDDDHIGSIKILLNDPDFISMLKQGCQIWMNYPNGEEIIFSADNDSAEISYAGGDLVKKLAQIEKRIEHKDNISIETFPKSFPLGNFITIDLLSPNQKKLKTLYKKWAPHLYEYSISNRSSSSDYGEPLSRLSIAKDKPCSWVPNGSSLAFILNYQEDTNKHKFLFLADAHTGIIRHSLSKLGFSEKKSYKSRFY